MKLSARSRYGTRMMVELAQKYNEGPMQIGEIARNQDISVKFLEQLIIPLKKANMVESVRGPKGGHMLAKAPEEISVGEIVRTLENDTVLVKCIGQPEICDRYKTCVTREIWGAATKALYDELDSFTLDQMSRQHQ